jgi:hypothetical protein
MLASSASTVECTIEICGHYFAVMFNLAIEGRALGPWDTGVGNEDVQTAIELRDDFIDGLLHGFPAGHIDLVCLA